MLQRSSSRPRVQEIHVTTHGTNIKHVLIHPQQRAETQARVYRLSRIQTDGPGSPGHAEIWLRGRVRVRGRRQRRKIQDPAPRTGQQLRQRKREIGMLGTAAAHVRNMIKGVTQGYKYDLRTVYAHFPVTVKVDEKAKVLKIENFTGEKTPRYARILEGVKVAIKGDDISVEGVDLKSVSQTAANIQDSTKIKKKDLRVFLDGIYVSGKGPAQTRTKPTK